MEQTDGIEIERGVRGSCWIYLCNLRSSLERRLNRSIWLRRQANANHARFKIKA